MSTEFAVDPAEQLIEELAEYTWDPLGFVQYAYYWGEGELAENAGPRRFQADILRTIGTHLQNPATRYQPCQIAIASGHDIGKTALMAFVEHWGMSTCEDCRIATTAGTGMQLKTKTIPETKKWARRLINRDWFEFRAESVRSRDVRHADTWRVDYFTWSEDNPQAAAGLHNQGKRIIVMFDEASTISDKVWEVIDGTLLDAETEIIWLAFGQPERVDGRFADCFGRFAHRWYRHQIDSRTVEGVNQQKLDQYVQDWGEDSDFVRVRVKGEFPRSNLTSFIGYDEVAQCRQAGKERRYASGIQSMPKLLSVDVARFGDDQTVCGVRQGRQFRILGKYRGKSAVWVAEQIISQINLEHPEQTIVDEDGVGGPVIDILRSRGFKVTGFHGGAAANDAVKWANKRAECWGLARDWLKAGAEIPDDPELAKDLTTPQYGFAKGKQHSGAILLESKDDIKARGMNSPDCGDCLAMTFAVQMRIQPRWGASPVLRQSAWN